MSAFIIIGPGETLSLGFDWDDEDWLGSETISTSAWTVYPTATTASSSNTTTTTSVKLSGCTFGLTYTLRNTITTDGGQTGVRDIMVRCTGSP